MSYSPHLLKSLGTNITSVLIQENRPCEQRLFQAIIVQAFEDALNPNPSKTETYYKIDAHNWFMYPDSVFVKICWLAGFDPDIITDRYKKLQATGQVTFTKIQQNFLKDLGVKEGSLCFMVDMQAQDLRQNTVSIAF